MKQIILKNLSSWLPAVIWMSVIFYFSSLTPKEIVSAGFGPEAYHINGHFLLFFVLAITYYKATQRIGLSVFLTLLYAFLDEFHQSFVPGRSVSWFDICIDTLGALLAGVFLWKLLYLLPQPLKNWLKK